MNTPTKDNTCHSDFQQDDIRNFLHVLKKSSKGKDKYHCPICDGNDFSVNKDGYFTCYNNHCDRTEIFIEAKKLAGEYRENPNTSSQNHRLQIKPKNKQAKTSKPKLKHQPVLIDRKHLTLAQFPSIPTDIPIAQKPNWIPQWIEKKLSELNTLDTLEIITYSYSKNTWLDRYQWQDESKEKGRNKSFLWGYRNPQTGDIKRQKVEEVDPERKPVQSWTGFPTVRV